MTTPKSSQVTVGQQATAQQYNDLRDDAIKTIITIASDVLKNSNDTERTTPSSSYVKIKEIKANEIFDGIMRIKFDMHATSVSLGYAKIYKNGSPIGTERVNDTDSYVTYSEDLSISLAVNDLLQIYAHRGGSSATCYVRNMRLYYSDKASKLGQDTLETELLIAKTAISMTNQDP